MLSDECDGTVKKRLKSGRWNIVGKYPNGFPQEFSAVTTVGISRFHLLTRPANSSKRVMA